MIGICTDSNAQLPPSLIERYAVEVVPLTVTVDGIEYLEGVDLGADTFYGHFANGHQPVVTVTQPSPGQFAAAYDDLAARGCTEILSIHVTAAVSGTINAARLGAHSVPVAVKLVDSGTASFGIGCCVWAAAEAIAQGARLDQAAAIAEQLAPTIGNVFISTPDLTAAGGVPILRVRDGEVEVIDTVATALDAVNAMAAHAIGFGERLRLAVGHSDASSAVVADALEAAVGEAASVIEVVRYRIGPSVGALSGPGTAGCFMFPA
jgi:fatty acid-binding protein DegV